MRVRIGNYEVAPSLNRISGPQGHVHVESRVMAVLEALLEHPGKVVSINELIGKAWEGAYVSDDAVTRCISILRRVLGDTRDEQAVIQTIPKKGYRLVPNLVSRQEPQPTIEEMHSKLTLEKVLADCSDHIYGFDREGHYLFASDAGAAAMGRKPAEMVGKCWRELGMPPEIMEPFHAEVASVFTGSASTVRKTVCYPTIYGLRHYEYVLDPVNDDRGETFAVVAIVRELRDPTEEAE